MLIVTIVNVFLFTALGLYITTRFQLTSLFNELHTLFRKLQPLKNEVSQRKDNLRDNEIANLQLQMKHIVWEIHRLEGHMFCWLSFSQNRMIADCCEWFLYYDEAKKYWGRCFKSKFPSQETEAEYHCRYAQFLYGICDYANGDIEFTKALELPNDTDGRKYINAETYRKWAASMIVAMNGLLYSNPHQNVSEFRKLVLETYNASENVSITIANHLLKSSALSSIAEDKERYCPWKDCI